MSRRGLTLIELLVVVAIIMSLGAMSSPMYSRFITQNNTQVVTDYLMGALAKARNYAMVSKNGSNWGVSYGSNKITLYSGNSYSTRTVAFDETFDVNANISMAAFDVNFSRMTGVGTTATVVISGGNNTHTIVVNAQGVASEQ